MRPLILICVLLYAVAMLGVRAFAKEFVAEVGAFGGLLLIFAMYFAARAYERRADQRR